MSFVDGFVAPVKAADKEKFLAHAREAAVMFREHGATQITECWGEDVPEGEATSFPLAVKREADEVVAFSWITWPSREVRDAAWAKMMQDPRMQPQDMPFDGKRMIYGGFAVILEG